jgi:hypothetical protein
MDFIAPGYPITGAVYHRGGLVAHSTSVAVRLSALPCRLPGSSQGSARRDSSPEP